jgi:PAS domain S-box-containing protein
VTPWSGKLVLIKRSRPVPENLAESANRPARAPLPPSERLFELLVQSVREYAIFLLDPDGNVVSWNPGAERLKGYRADEITGQHFSRFYPSQVRREVIDAELVTAVKAGVFRDEGWRVRKDGTQFWADVTITPVYESSGGLVGFAKVTRDMTDRRRAEEEHAARQTSWPRCRMSCEHP